MRLACLFSAVGLGLACTSPNLDPDPVEPGSLVVISVTTGADLDSDGYSLTIDGGSPHQIAINDSLTINGLVAGQHQAAIGGLAANCTLAGPNPAPVTVPSQGVTKLTASVVCTSNRGTVNVVIQTSGADVDDGYDLTFETRPTLRTASTSQVSYGDVPAGNYALTVADIQPNCALSGTNPRQVTVVGGMTTTVNLQLACTALPVGHPLGFVIARRTIPGGPFGVTVNGTGAIYAALIGGNELIRGDLATRTFSDRVVVGQTPPHVVFNGAGNRVYATLQTGQMVVAVDATTNLVVGSAPLSSDGFNLLVGPGDAKVYVTTADGTLHIFSPALAPIATLQVGSAANGLVASPDGQTIFVTSRDAGTVTAVNTTTNAIARTYVVGGDLQRIVIAPDGGELYIADETGNLRVVNVASGTVLTLPQPIGSAPYGIGVTKNGAEIWLLMALSSEIRVFDRTTRALLKTIPVGGILRNIVFSADGSEALVTNEQQVVFVR
jgi:DNA-binding beta-propeller fold protein YncE